MRQGTRGLPHSKTLRDDFPTAPASAGVKECPEMAECKLCVHRVSVVFSGFGFGCGSAALCSIADLQSAERPKITSLRGLPQTGGYSDGAPLPPEPLSIFFN